MKKVLITGATGLIGKNIVERLESRGDEVKVFTRNVSKGESKLPSASKYVKWDYHKYDEWKHELNGMDAVIHLAGANLFAERWDDEYKKKIIDSRKISTQNLIKAVSEADKKPEVFICASGVGYYGDRGDEELTESSTPGNDFLAEVCRIWEDEAAKAETLGLRYASVRTGIVLSEEGGALKEFLTPFKLFVGGPLGDGRQWFPWIHINDIVNIYLHTLDNKNLNGAVNAAAPSPVRMELFAKELGDVLNRPSIFKVPKFALKAITGEAADSITGSQKVIPKKLIDENYKFKFPDLKPALKDLLK